MMQRKKKSDVDMSIGEIPELKSKEYTITVKKTFQERQFEPYSIEMTHTFSIDGSVDMHDKLVKFEYKKLDRQVSEFIDEHKKG